MMRRALLFLLLIVAACSEAPLIRIIEDHPPPPFDNKLKLSGKVCTTDPYDLTFPLKVLFVIDTSQSMNVNDPVSQTEPDPLAQTNRCRAIRDVISNFFDLTLPVGSMPMPCSTGVSGCGKGLSTCATCGTGAHFCIGPDCVPGQPVRGVPACPANPPPAGSDSNGFCVKACATDADCPPNKQGVPLPCEKGVCGKQLDPGVEFAIMRFGSAKQVLTKNAAGKEGFTRDIRELVASLPQVNNGGSVTDYEGALSEAFKTLYQDMHDSQQDNRAAVSRTKYVVVFLSDGEPYPRINDEGDWDKVPPDTIPDLLGGYCTDPKNCTKFITEYNVDGRILRRAKDIMGLKTLFHIGDIRIHTAYLVQKNAPAVVQEQAISLLKLMANIGKGTFRNFQNGEEINFLHVDFSSLRRVFRLKNLMVTNINARPVGADLIMDSDGDGLDDDTERAAGSNPALLDSERDGFSDTVEHFYRSSGWDSLNPGDADCSLKANDMDSDGLPDDTDGDGLADCEERFMGTARNLIDSDADGIPDGIEVKFGTNPVVVDVEEDLDFDGMPNGDEIRLHTDPRADDATHRSRLSYRYLVKQVGSGIETVGIRCLEDKDCPTKADCRLGHCRCTDDSSCSSRLNCTKDSECKVTGERCEKGKCLNATWTCQQPPAGIEGPDPACVAKKHITCYSYDVENITLVSPKASGPGAEEGWNRIELVFGQVPFDNPMDFGMFSIACVRARYDSSNGAKLPVTGQVTVPETAWHDPRELARAYSATATDAAGKMPCGIGAGGSQVYCNAGDLCVNATSNRCGLVKCVCPDGKEGICPAPQ